MKLLWLTDLHLDRTDEKQRTSFCKKLCGNSADAVVITGDISDARHLPGHLRELGQACSPRPVYFVLGNHDFYGSSFDDVDQSVASVCKDQANLRHLGQGEIIRLGAHDALVGHRGWADGRAGWGSRSPVWNPDHSSINDFRSLSRRTLWRRVEELGKASGKYLREVLPYALRCYEHVWLATHVPPFTAAASFNGKLCGGHHLPHYTNLSAGCAINGISKYFPKSRTTILCGHTHSPAAVKVGGNIEVLVGRVSPGSPDIQRIFSLN